MQALLDCGLLRTDSNNNKKQNGNNANSNDNDDCNNDDGDNDVLHHALGGGRVARKLGGFELN